MMDVPAVRSSTEETWSTELEVQYRIAAIQQFIGTDAIQMLEQHLSTKMHATSMPKNLVCAQVRGKTAQHSFLCRMLTA